MAADGAARRGLLEPAVEIVFFTVDFSVHVVKGFSAQRPAAADADEARGVVQVPHRLWLFKKIYWLP